MAVMLDLQMSAVKRFHDAAWLHLDAARLLLDQCSLHAASLLAHEVVYLGGYAVECILKALLLSRTRAKRHEALESEFIASLGHDLEKIKARLEKLRKPVLMSAEVARSFRAVRRRWSSEMRYYPAKKTTEEAREFLEAVVVQLNWICGGN
jgi:hypothetical protein